MNKSKVHKYLILTIIYIFIIFIFIVLNTILSNNDITKEKIIDNINKEYENDIHISNFSDFYNKEKYNIIKIIQPEVDYSNFFQVLVYNNNTNKIDVYKIFKGNNEKWEDFKDNYLIYKNIIKNGGVGFFYGERKNIEIFSIIGGLIQILFAGLLLYSLLRMTGFGTKIGMKLFIPNKENLISLNDIGGIEGNKKEIEDILKTLKNWKNFSKKGIRSIRGILFYGPPGTGKTMLAKAIASEIGSEIFIASGNDFGSKYINEGSEKVKKSFKKIEDFIKKHKKDFAILFIDEIDSVLKQRGNASGHNEDDKVVNTFLDRIDGIEGSKNIIIIGATNYIDKIDEAVLSRFDKKIPFKLPNKKERLDIIIKKINKIKEKDNEVKIKKDIDLNIFASNTVGMSGRDIDNILNDVHRNSILYNREIDENFIQEIFGDFILGKDNLGIDINENDMKIIAYHELGHAIIGFLNGKEVHTVTTIPKGNALGITWSIDKKEIILKNSDDLIKSIHELMGGRIAEKIFLGKISTGASNDYEKITSLAFSYFRDYNFEYDGFKLGYVLNSNNNNNQLIDVEIYKILEKNVKKLITNEEKNVEKILKNNKDKFEKLIDKLIKNRIIFKEDIENVFNKI